MAHKITDYFKLALAQLNPVVGDIATNLAKAREARSRAAEAGADLVVFTELYLTGYPIEKRAALRGRPFHILDSAAAVSN